MKNGYMAMVLLMVGSLLPIKAVVAGDPLSIRAIAPMQQPRAVHQVVALDANEVLVIGGCGGESCSPVQSSAEVFDVAQQRFTMTTSMQTPRVSHAAAVLANGDVLVVGGWTGEAATATAERFDRATRTFQTLESMATPRIDPIALTLDDGRVLIAGGATAIGAAVASVELFEPSSRRFVPIPPMREPRTHHVGARLPDGRILITGGLRARDAPLASAEIFDPRSGRFSATGAMAGARYKHAMVTLADGRILVMGGSSGGDDRNRLASTEIYDANTHTFAPGPSLLEPRFKIPSSAGVLRSGDVIIAGGAADVEMWRPGAPSFARVDGTLGTAYEFSSATVLNNDQLLVLGGYDTHIRPTAQAWLVGPLRAAPEVARGFANEVLTGAAP
ncbi:MAG: kelch repeat-containing protein [Dokdonella sp.]